MLLAVAGVRGIYLYAQPFSCWDKVSHFCLCWPGAMILPISASWVPWNDSYWLRWGMENFLPQLASNSESSDFSLPSS
jgi:hypothetical protein